MFMMWLKFILYRINSNTASDPVCQLNQNITNDTVVVTDELQIWCTVVYSGTLRPSMKWETSDRRVLTSEVTSEPHNTSGRIFISTLVSSVNSVNKRGIRVRCVTSFEMDVSHKTSNEKKSIRATNNPDYIHTWTSPMLYGECEYFRFSCSVLTISSILLWTCQHL